MDFLKEGGSVSRLPLLNGSNYAHWKARMKAFIKTIDEKAWHVVLTSWIQPITIDDVGKEVLKLEEKWSTEEDQLANNNSRALNVIFNRVDANQFKLISTCESAEDAWEILQIAYEGMAAIRLSKLQILTTRFENLRMLMNETVSNFYSKLCHIANESFALCDKIYEEKLMRKALRSLSQKFAYKVAAIKDTKDMRSMKLDELMGSLHTFEMNLNETRRRRKKNIVFQAKVEEVESDDEKDLTESITQLSYGIYF